MSAEKNAGGQTPEPTNRNHIEAKVEQTSGGALAVRMIDESKIGAFVTKPYAEQLRTAFPNATFVGFTGTPIDQTYQTFGAEIDRIHWVATDEAHQRRGLCGAMLCELLKRHKALGTPGGVYLISQTLSYTATRIYQRFGFRRLLTRCPAEYHPDAPFAETAARAWAIIDEKLR